jgi:hypothetical protein
MPHFKFARKVPCFCEQTASVDRAGCRVLSKLKKETLFLAETPADLRLPSDGESSIFSG